MNSPKDSTPHLPATVALSSHGLTLPPGPARIVTRMAENMLAQASLRERALASQRLYRIGDYEFREPDHEQIQRWAKMLGVSPEEMVRELADWEFYRGCSLYDDSSFGFEVQGGSIISLAWHFAGCPLTDWAWVAGLRLERLAVTDYPDPALPTLPGCLRELYCWGEEQTELDLRPVPGLTTLFYCGTQLTELDLRPVPGLTYLYCCSNKLTELDLRPVPGLTYLDCGNNQLTELDLRPVPGLTYLNCSSNRLTNLWCNDNQLETLDLRDNLPYWCRINGKRIK